RKGNPPAVPRSTSLATRWTPREYGLRVGAGRGRAETGARAAGGAPRAPGPRRMMSARGRSVAVTRSASSRMNDVFLSYHSSDQAIAQRFADTLEAHGLSVWWDREIPVGKSFDEVIEQQLTSARCVV